MNRRLIVADAFALAALAGCATGPAACGKRSLMIVGNDENEGWSDTGTPVISAPGKDAVSGTDIGTDLMSPRTLVSLPLMNTVVGPPVNLAITPDEKLALVANSIRDRGRRPARGRGLQQRRALPQIGNLITKDISIPRVESDRIVDTGKRIPIAGHLASMRARTRESVRRAAQSRPAQRGAPQRQVRQPS